MVKLAFHVGNFSVRGSEVAIYDYALGCRDILGIDVIIVAPRDIETKRDVKGNLTYDKVVADMYEQAFGAPHFYTDINEITGCDALYVLKSGENDGLESKSVPTIVHCVFICNRMNKHGSVYGAISDCVVGKSYTTGHDSSFSAPVVGHITEDLVTASPPVNRYGIPNGATVIGRYGGWETFDVEFVFSAIEKVLSVRPDVYFLLANTSPSLQHPRILYVDTVHGKAEKGQFIALCDAMLHARAQGESFGLAVAEFCSMRRPILTFKNPSPSLTEHGAHHDTLGSAGIYYSDETSLVNELLAFRKGTFLVANPYGKFTRWNTMREFNDSFLVPLGLGSHVMDECRVFDGKRYCFSRGDPMGEGLHGAGWKPHVYMVLEALATSDMVFIDVGAGIGYFSIRMADKVSHVIAVEPDDSAIRANVGASGNHVTVITDSALSLDLDIRVRSAGVDILRIDYKGLEAGVITGAANLIRENNPYIILTVDRTDGSNPKDVFGRFASFGYDVCAIQSPHPTEYLAYPAGKNDVIASLFSLGKLVPNDVAIPHLCGLTAAIIGRSVLGDAYTVYPMCNWMTSEDLVACWSKMGDPVGSWKNLRLTPFQNGADYTLIVNSPPPGATFDPAKTVVMRMEPDETTAPAWNSWIGDKDEFLAFMTHSIFHNNCEWHLSKTWAELKNMTPEKTETALSAVISDQLANIGHRLRVEFMKALQKRGEVDVHIYGRGNPGFSDHHGELPYHEKDRAIFPYKYTLNAESCAIPGYFTEKVIDAILGETLLFYWGCPDIADYIDERAYIILDLTDIEGSCSIVRAAMENNEWEKRLPYIRKAKTKILNDMAFMPRLWSIIETSRMTKVVVNLDSRPDRWDAFVENANRAKLKNYVRFSATDGRTSDGDPFRALVMDESPPQMRCPGVIGCAGSHIRIWNECASVNKPYLVLEDDITFEPHFMDTLSTMYSEATRMDGGWDVVFIGYHIDEKNVPECTPKRLQLEGKWPMEMLSSFQSMCMEWKKFEPPFGPFHGGTFAYLLSPRGAKKMLNLTRSIGIMYPVDYHMMCMSRVPTGGRSAVYCVGDVDVYMANCRTVLSVLCSDDTDIDIQPWLKGPRISHLKSS